MLHAALMVLGAAPAEEASKTPFYVLGGALVLWAVALSAVGITQPDFPRRPPAARSVMAISVLLVVAVLVATLITN